jgi:hypothetical protein
VGRAVPGVVRAVLTLKSEVWGGRTPTEPIVSSVVTALPTLRCDRADRWRQSRFASTEGTGCAVGAFGLRWTKAISQAQLSQKAMVKSVVFPAGVTVIGETTLEEFEFIESVVFCTVIGSFAPRTARVSRRSRFPTVAGPPDSTRSTAALRLPESSSPVGCTTISNYSFGRCAALTSVQIPSGCVREGTAPSSAAVSSVLRTRSTAKWVRLRSRCADPSRP